MSEPVQKDDTQKNVNCSGIEEEQEPNKNTVLKVDEDAQSKEFFWDLGIKLFASGMLALTLLEVLSSISGEAVQCLTPDNYTRDQGAFINAYCTQFTQRTDFFLFMLVAQAILVYGPHFLWSSVYFGKLRYFTALALSLDRQRDNKTGEFDLKNFVSVQALVQTFGSTYVIYITYLAKLCLQLVIAGVFIGVCATLFNEYDPTFDCPANDSLYLINDSWPLDGQIVCVLSSLNLLFAVWWTNFVLLTGTVVVSLCGLVWCGLNHQTKLNWKEVARFVLQSGIQPSYYRPKSWKDRWFSRYALKFRIRSNLDFLFLRLYRDDAGRAQVLRKVLIAQLIQEQEQRLQERLSVLRQVKSAEIRKDLLKMVEKKRIIERGAELYNFNTKRAPPNENLGITLESVLCNFLTSLHLEKAFAIDFSFGTPGYKMLITTLPDCNKMVAVNFDPHYLNEERPFMESNFLSEVFTFRTWSTIFSKEKDVISKLKDEIGKHCFSTKQTKDKDGISCLRDNETPENSFNIVLVGPIPTEESQRVITVHWMLMMLLKHKLLRDEFFLIAVRPLEVEGQSVEFTEFEPVLVSDQDKTVCFSECAYLRHDSDSSQRKSSTAGPGKIIIRYVTTDSAAAGCGPEAVVSEKQRKVVVGYKSAGRPVNCYSTDRAPDPLKRGVVVECGSSLCKIDIRAYKGVITETSQ